MVSECGDSVIITFINWCRSKEYFLFLLKENSKKIRGKTITNSILLLSTE